MPRTWNLDAEVGSFSITGQPDFLRKQSLIVPALGTFALTGNDATLTYTPAGAFELAVDAGSFTLTGNDVGLADAEELEATAGTFALTGNDVSLHKGLSGLNVSVGSFTLTGNDTEITRGYVLSVETGVFRLKFGARRRVVFIF